MNVEKRIKRVNKLRKHRFQRLLDRIAATNNTGLSDETVLAILNADRGPWSEAMTGEMLLASLGIGMQ
ncbi:hypothetical protein [Burkholderia stagnalis]|uniref:hypothetical protein n=1 Tax=Burkholderia stagnalis TaxID=1503054 RepID=UPI00075F100B|nr:hypothetical protein [Burkholderia stagnalis]KVN60316.1 hypothetical protein WT14_19370 [Burkholderia stagnalis]